MKFFLFFSGLIFCFNVYGQQDHFTQKKTIESRLYVRIFPILPSLL